MSLYEQWKELAEKKRSEQEYNIFWQSYFEEEKNAYAKILASGNNVVSGKLTELAGQFDMDNIKFIGFIDGINSSLTEEVEVEELTEASELNMEIEYEKLYFNMLDAKAEWLYNLEEWEDILTSDRRKEITKEFKLSKIAVSEKIGRNEPCPCGSGQKYKKCCL